MVLPPAGVCRPLAVDGNDNLALAGTFGIPVDFGSGSVTPKGGGVQDLYVAKYGNTRAKALQWIRTASIPGGVTPQAVASDAAGNVAVAGFYSGNFVGNTLDFGSGRVLTGDQNGTRNAFVVVYSAAGNVVYAKAFAGTGASATATGVAFTTNGAVAVTGFYKGNVDFGGQRSTSVQNTEDIFVAGLSATGALQWLKHTGDTDNDRGTTIAGDTVGNVAVSGYFGGKANFGGYDLVNPSVVVSGVTVMERDAFLVKYTAAGAHVWSKNFKPVVPSYNGTLPQGVAMDRSGNVLLTGAIVSAVDFGGGPLSGSTSNDIFFAKFSAAGTHLWSNRTGTIYDDRGKAIAADAAGNVIATGLKSNVKTDSIGDAYLARMPG